MTRNKIMQIFEVAGNYYEDENGNKVYALRQGHWARIADEIIQLSSETPCTDNGWIEKGLVDEAISDVILIAVMHNHDHAHALIKNQFFIAAKEDLPSPPSK